jgi:hypothetical protein
MKKSNMDASEWRTRSREKFVSVKSFGFTIVTLLLQLKATNVSGRRRPGGTVEWSRLPPKEMGV